MRMKLMTWREIEEFGLRFDFRIDLKVFSDALRNFE